MQQELTREAVGIFDDIHKLNEAVTELETTAFPRHDITVLGDRHALEEKYGAKTIDPHIAGELAEVPRKTPVHTEEINIARGLLAGGGAYFGATAAALAAGPISFPALIAAAMVGGIGGGATGALITKIIENQFGKSVQEQIDSGGLLLWVRTPEPDKEILACEIMKRHGAHDVHIHAIN